MKTKFKNCLLVINPGASRTQRGKTYESQLIDQFGKAAVNTYRLEVPKDFDDTSGLLAALKPLSSDSLLVMQGGDGTVNWVINRLMELKKDAKDWPTILPIWGGNACDFASMLNGKRTTNIKPILRKGEPMKIYPLKYTLAKKGKQETGFAACYVSFGAVAYAAKVLEDSALVQNVTKIRPLRFVSEVAVSLKSLHLAKRFSVTKAGEQQQVYDIVMVNGPRLAKTYRLPAELDKPKFIALTIIHKYPVLASHLAALTRAWTTGESVSAQEFKLDSDVWMQVDGEVRQLKAGTTVTVVPASQPFNGLTTL